MASKKFAAALTSDFADTQRRDPHADSVASWIKDRLGDSSDAMESADVRTVIQAYEEGTAGLRRR